VAAVSTVDNASANVVVPDVLLIVNAAIGLLLDVIVPVPRILAVKLVNTPAPLAKVKLFKFNDVAGTVNAVVPKLSVLNQLPELNVATDEPLLSVKFGALVDEPLVVPKLKVLVVLIVLVKPPVPVYVKLVASAILNTVASAVVVANTILPAPNVIERVFVLVETNVPVVKVNPANANVPEVSVVAAVAPVDNASANVVVPDVLLIVNAAIGLVLDVIVPVPTMVAVNPVNTPAPLDKVKLLKFTVVAGTVNTVLPKLNVLNQLPLASVNTEVPLPVSVTFGALVDEPPVVPKERVLVTEASVVNPPVPV
jgi:hypothetical protein